MGIIQAMNFDRKRMTVILRSSLILLTALLILSVILTPVVSALFFLVGAGAIGWLVLAGRRTEKVRIKTSRYRSLPPGRSPPFFS
jgi:CHASE2 domain-containing sensor protein